MLESIFGSIDDFIIAVIVISAVIGTFKGTQFYQKKVKGTKIAYAINFIESTVEEIMNVRNQFQEEINDKLSDVTKSTLHSTAKQIVKRNVPNLDELVSEDEADEIIHNTVNRLKGSL